MLFRYVRGDYVEISSYEEGFFGSYYTATVLRPEGNNHYLVEYETLLADDEKAMLRDVAHAGEMRSCPPEIRATEFLLGDVIDAFDNDGWWVGTIEGRDRPGFYWVKFDSTGDCNSYGVNRLRVHQELDEYGRWSISKFHKSMKI